jgi:hypothetical protein
MSDFEDDDDVDDPGELAVRMAGWILNAQTEIERLAAETGKRQERSFGLEAEETGQVLLRVHMTCEPGQFAERTLEGELTAFAEDALGYR